MAGLFFSLSKTIVEKGNIIDLVGPFWHGKFALGFALICDYFSWRFFPYMLCLSGLKVKKLNLC